MAMKKNLFLMILLSLWLVPAAGESSYLLRFKSGGSVATSAYWTRDGWTYFNYAGGVAGMRSSDIARIDRRDESDAPNIVRAAPAAKMETATPPVDEKALAAAKAAEADKAAIETMRKKKDQLSAELDQLLQQQREATARGDNEAKVRLDADIIRVSKEAYAVTDEATARNKGKLPEGWWDRKESTPR
jgi:hypothetical protein